MSISVETALSSISSQGFSTTSRKAIQQISEKDLSGNEYRNAIRDAISTEVIDPTGLDDTTAEYFYKYLVQELVQGEDDIEVAIETAREKANEMAERVTTGDLQYVNAGKNGQSKSEKPKKTKKKDLAEQIYQDNKDDLTRKQMIDMFVSEVGMTKAGASTYYHNCKKKFDQ